MKKIFPGLLLSLLFPAMLAAENTEESPRKPLSDANITGHVQDAATGEHLPYITVVVKGTTIGTATDGTGHYFLKNLPAGEFVLEASMLGYGTVEKRVTTTSGKTIEVNFVLTEDSERMDEIVVTANRNETNKKESSTIVNITSGKLFSAVGSSTLSESMNFTPGLRIENNCGNCAVTQLRINGLEGHYSQILLDSRPMKFLGFHAEDAWKTITWFQKKGQRAVLFGRCIPIIRSLISVPAGMARMEMPKFLLFTIIGSTVWNILLVGTGAAVGVAWEQAAGYVKMYADIVFLVLAAGAVCFPAVHLYRKKHK